MARKGQEDRAAFHGGEEGSGMASRKGARGSRERAAERREGGGRYLQGAWQSESVARPPNPRKFLKADGINLLNVKKNSEKKDILT